MKKIVIYAASAMLMFGGTVSAETAAQPTIDYKTDTGRIYITGSLGEEFAGDLVSLTVYKTTEGTSGISSGTAGTLNWYDQMTTNEKGDYSFDYAIAGEAGTRYTFSIAADELTLAREKEFVYYPPSQATTVILPTLATAKQNNDAQAVDDIVTSYEEYLQLDTTYYSQLDASNKLIACSNTLAGDVSSIDNFKQGFADCSTIVYLNGLSDSSVYETELLKFIATSNKVAVNYYNDSQFDKAAVLSKLMAMDFTKKSELVTFVNNTIFADIANKAGVWGEMYSLLRNAQTEIGIDFTAYNALGSRGANAIQLMLGKTYSSCDEIKTAFNTSVATVASTPVNQGGGGGGSSSSSGGSSLVTMPQVTEPASPFGDLQDVQWAKDSIRILYEKGVVSGDENGNFNPNKNVSRAEYVKMLVSAINIKESDVSLNFDDVPQDAWYHDFVVKAAQNGLVSGIDENNFGPSLPITRQDAAAIIYRAIGISGVELAELRTADISDETEIAGYAKDAVKALYSANILNGVGDGRFAPLDNMTRAQAAVIICNFLEGLEAAK